jgi:hypothetical protein
MCDKRLPDGSFIGVPIFRDYDYACSLCRTKDGLPIQERCPSNPSWKASFDK